MSKPLVFVTALLTAVSFSSIASAADTSGSTTRQWGGLWMGFGTGYAGSGNSASGGSSEVCLTSAPSNTPSSVEQTECVVSDNTATTVAQAVARGSVQGTAINSGTSITTVALSANQGVAAVAAGDDQEIAITLAIASNPGSTLASTSAGAGNGSQTAIATASAQGLGGVTVADADTANIGNPVAATVLAQGFSLTNSSTGVYGGASYASAEVDSAKAEALAIALGGLPQIGEFSATGGGITPEIHLRLDHQTESNWIFGAEVNFSMAEGGEGSSAELVIDPYDAGGAGPDTVTIVRGFDTETNALFSARLRLGYAMGDYMVYGTGGLAYADFSATLTTTGTYLGAEASESRTESGEAFGGVIGGGVSTFVADNATVSLEALYYNFDDEIDFDGTNEGMSVTLDDAFSLMAKFSIRTN